MEYLKRKTFKNEYRNSLQIGNYRNNKEFKKLPNHFGINFMRHVDFTSKLDFS